VVAALVPVVLLVLLPGFKRPNILCWPGDVESSVRVVDGDSSIDVELRGLPIVSGEVAYEGPRMTVDAENWKPPHVYRGVSLRSVVDRAGLPADVDTLTLVAVDGWNKTIPREVLEGSTACGIPILALSIDDQLPSEWDDAPVLIFLPEDQRLSNEDMLEALGGSYAHFFGEELSSTGMMVKGVVFVVVNYDGGALPRVSGPLDRGAPVVGPARGV
jgi:hypothetical protein